MKKVRSGCNRDSALITKHERFEDKTGGGRKMAVTPSARLKVDFADPRTKEAIRVMEDAGCAVTTIPISAQPYPELLVGGRYYRGMEQIQAVADEIKSFFKNR